MQALSHRLHPPQLEFLGIVKASAAVCREIALQHGVDVRFHAEGILQVLSKRIAVCLYRVLQEALQNAIKHSGTGTVEVLLGGGSGQIELTVDDHGVGFDLLHTQGPGPWSVEHERTAEKYRGTADHPLTAPARYVDLRSCARAPAMRAWNREQRLEN